VATTVSASLKLFDQFSATLGSAQRHMQETLNVAERLRQKLQGKITMAIDWVGSANQANAAAIKAQIIQQIGVIEAEIRISLPSTLTTMLTDLRKLVLQLTLAVRQLRQSLKPPPVQPALPPPPPPPVSAPTIIGGVGGMAKLTRSLLGIASAYLSIATARKLAENGVVMQQQENLLGARMGDLELGKKMFNSMVKQADDLNVSAKQLSVTWNSFLPLAENVGQLKQMAEWANRLSKLDPAQGIEGATIAMKEVFSGDTQSLVERFEISRSLANQLKTAAKSGDFNTMNIAMEKVFSQLKMTKAQVAALNAQPLNQLTGGISDLGNHINVFSKNVVQAVAIGYVWFKGHIPNAIQSTQDAVTNMWSKVEPVLSFLAQGIAIAGIAFLAFWLISVLVNGSLLAMIVNYSMLAFAAISSAATTAAAWLVANWPLLLIIVIIAAVIAAFLYFGGTVKQVVGAVVGGLFFLGSVIWDAIAVYLKFVINLVMLLGEGFVAFATGAVKVLEWLGKAIINALLSPIDQAIKGLNFLIDLANKIPNVKIDKIASTEELFGKIGPLNFGGDALMGATKTMDEIRRKASAAIPLVNPVDAYKTGYGYGEGIVDSAGNLPGQLKGALGGMMGNLGDMFKVGGGVPDSTKIDRVDVVGKIGDTVDISSEDLKVMRELAEMKSIQNFVTLTPTLQVTTGDIHHAVDVDEMIGRIETYMENQLSISAQEVYE
jgi:hypothetical protein